MNKIRSIEWFVCIVFFLFFFATMSLCQAYEGFQYWQYLSAGWWFIVFYGLSSVIVYLVMDRMKSGTVEESGTLEAEKSGADELPESPEAKMLQIGTRDLFLTTLNRIGCQYELSDEKDDDRIFFSYQGENFTASASDDGWYVHIWDPRWYHIELYDVDGLSRLKKAINLANLNCATTTVYTIDEDGGNVDVHCKATIPIIPQIPSIEDYLRTELRDFFRAHQYVSSEIENLRKKEEAER